LSAMGAGSGARSYSDFMRSLAAKYNNNEYFTPTTAGSSPPQTSATKQDIFPFLGLGAFPQGFPGFSLPGLPPGFNPFLPPTSTEKPPSSGGGGGVVAPVPSLKRPRDQADAALDLTEKRVKTEGDGSPRRSSPPPSQSSPPPRPAPPSPPSQRVELDGEPNEWTVEQVATFVMEIDICREYGQVFRDNKIDGGCLPLLTESHLTTGLGLKLGPALKLLTALRRRLGPNVAGCVKCAHCHQTPPSSSTPPPPPPAAPTADQEAEVSA